METNIKQNFLYNLINQIVNLIVPFILTPYISRALTVKGVGEYSFVFSITSYFVLFATLGTDLYGQREISMSQSDIISLNKTFIEIFLLRCILSLIAIILYVFFIILIGHAKLLLILILYIVNVAVDISWFYSGLEMFRFVCIRNIVVKIINAILIVFFVHYPSDLWIYTLIMSTCTVMSSIVLWNSITKFIRTFTLNDINPLHHFKGSIVLFIPTIAISLYTIFDKSMIGFFSPNFNENGYYEQAYRIINIALKIVTAFAYVVMPHIAYFKSQNDIKSINDYFYKVANFVWFISLPIMFGLIAISSNLVPWFFGEGYEGTIIILQLLSILVPIIGFSNLIGIQYLIPTKRDKIFTMSVIIGAIINVCLNLILIPKFFAFGAAIASIIGELSVTIYQGFKVKNEISFKKVLILCYNYLVGTLIMFLSLMIMSCNLRASIANSLLMVFIGLLTYIGFLIVRKDAFIIKNFKVTLKRKESSS